MRRLSLFLRGPGVLILLLGIALAGKALAQRNAAITPATPAPVLFVLSVSGATTTTDHATEMAAHVISVRVNNRISPGIAGTVHQLTISVQLSLRNMSRTAQPVDPVNFYQLAMSGQTYGTGRPVGGLPALRQTRVPPGRTVVAWIAFVVPATPERLALLWNDSNRLLPPVTIASVSVARAHPR